jgi:ribulose-phosphate 3-epimerase
MSKFLLSSSILSADFRYLADQIHLAEEGGVDWIHIDVIDGHFAPNITMGPFIVEACRKITRLPLDVHLMIENPDLFVEAFASSGASNLTVHIENNPHIHRTIQKIHSLNCTAGIAINPGTPASHIHEVLNWVDLILVMTVNPGFSGQSFVPEVISKIVEIHRMAQERHLEPYIEVDGGINQDTLPKTFLAGANVFVAATAIFKFPEGIQAGIKTLRESVE